ncbi:penicillin-binding protein activator [Testudinibacter sp. TR-2022]|uniref:penicillin-binding protein activator n=1 Tax=Testudinibacter sp. TR-2022 TaxID=2585029 RepID=UPI0011195687|nr:penicillin-binding protein activator [Testudinibacter sp. TR-2022]TNH03533.1 penicillin-binding protein activator [Pasteurellaceae bacterium Phil31]TNH07955.1 penicillin-binding protein activator [Testudinibacter sp. TR-2022]TNH10361.1 penicillin-binding protein activator [Testudinibacter sp. TR-2022]TNH13615.1 penicillin-binding protein activator [Testudinibacter sp. TR-2022]TNH20853.1 penicillin-binding protein activator [Testudinibacter sp. TR-2022]
MAILLQSCNIKSLLMPFLMVLFLAACGTDIFSGSGGSLLQRDANASSEFYLNRAEQATNNTEKTNYQLLAARVLLTENKMSQAESLLASLQKLDKEQTLDKNLLMAQIYANKRANNNANTTLQTIPLNQLSNSQKARYYITQAKIADNQNNLTDALRSLVLADQVISDTERKQQNINNIWKLLRAGNATTLRNIAPESGDIALNGWLSLINAYNSNIAQPENLRNAIQSWRSAYPNHSAAYLLPTEIQDALNYQQVSLSNIALLLPTSGNAQLIGNTIKKGFDDARGQSAVTITTYDTMTTPMADIIAQAKANGIQAIVGPLIKNQVDNLLAGDTSGLQVLALNSTANAQPIANVCYYGLSPEAEARSAADRIWNDGIRNPLVIVPQNDLGQRTASAFNLRWQQLAATDASTQFYHSANDILAALQSGLGNSQSEQRSETIAAITGANVQTNSYTREDIQALYIVADSNDLLDIKNMINNSAYGRNLKLYATSRSNSPNNGPDYRLTMEGLKFSEIPFLSDTQNSQYNQVANTLGGDYSLIRLYAMGSDAWLLINKFNELRQIPGYTINGLTGKLSAGNGCNIDRDMAWLEYQGGVIRILN